MHNLQTPLENRYWDALNYFVREVMHKEDYNTWSDSDEEMLRYWTRKMREHGARLCRSVQQIEKDAADIVNVYRSYHPEYCKGTSRTITYRYCGEPVRVR